MKANTQFSFGTETGSVERMALASFLLKYMNYTDEQVKELITHDSEQIRALATRVRESILKDKTITKEYKEKIEGYVF